MDEWKRFHGKQTSIAEFINSVKGEGRNIIIGTDSQTSEETKYTTAIVFYKPRKGASCIYRTEKQRKPHSLHEQLSRETWLSIGAALEIMEACPEIVTEVVNIHLDVNDNPKHASSKYKSELIGTVVGQGFQCEVKPNSWVATHIADHIVRN